MRSRAKTAPRFFAVRNFDRLQHYDPKNRRPIWIKLYNSLLDDPELASLALRDRFLYCGLLLLASRLDNRIPYDIEYLSNAMQTRERIDLNALFKKGFLIACPRRTVLAHARRPLLAQNQKREEREKIREEGKGTGQDSEAVRVKVNGTGGDKDPEQEALLPALKKLGENMGVVKRDARIPGH